MKVVNLKRGPIIALSASAFLIFFILYSFTASTQETVAIRDVRIRSIKDERGTNDNKVEFPGMKEEKKTEILKVEKKEEIVKEVKKVERKEEDEKLKKVEKSTGEGDDIAKKRDFVREMMLHAWYGYRNYTWGANEIRPAAKTPNNQAIFGGSKMAATIIDAADTLWMMGLKDEYKQARDFIQANFSIANAQGTLSVFETNVRFVGGLLALRALTGEELYTDMAREVAEALLPAFNTPSGISYSNIDIRTKSRWFLHPGCVMYILEAAKKVIARDSTLIDIEPEKEPIMFFGNIYASFPDLVARQVTFSGSGKTLKMVHWPEGGWTAYLGNIVNRGFHNVETLCFILLQKCLWPDKVTILRGQEETRTFNRSFTSFYENLCLYGGVVLLYGMIIVIIGVLALRSRLLSRRNLMAGIGTAEQVRWTDDEEIRILRILIAFLKGEDKLGISTQHQTICKSSAGSKMLAECIHRLGWRNVLTVQKLQNKIHSLFVSCKVVNSNVQPRIAYLSAILKKKEEIEFECVDKTKELAGITFIGNPTFESTRIGQAHNQTYDALRPPNDDSIWLSNVMESMDRKDTLKSQPDWIDDSIKRDINIREKIIQEATISSQYPIFVVIGAMSNLGRLLSTALRTAYGIDNVVRVDCNTVQSDELGIGKIYNTDIMDANSFASLILQYDVSCLVYCEALQEDTVNPDKLLSSNARIHAVYEMAREHSLKVFIPSSFFSFGSDAMHGDTHAIAVKPKTIFGISKVYCELLAEYYHASFGVDSRCIRMPFVISSTNSGEGVSDCLWKMFHDALKNGNHVCYLSKDTPIPLIYDTDCVAAVILMISAQSSELSARTYDVNGFSATPEEIAKSIKKFVPDFQITYEQDFLLQDRVRGLPKVVNDDKGRQDWNWNTHYGLDKTTEIMIAKIKRAMECEMGAVPNA